MKREETVSLILKAKENKGLKWSEIAAQVGASEVWVTTVLLGQGTFTEEQAKKAGDVLELEEEVVRALTTVPYRGTMVQMPPTDPVLYRLYEVLLVYGPAIKELIHEKFGDGIMSAIDFDMDMKRVEDPKGDRVSIAMTGKFLSYKKW